MKLTFTYILGICCLIWCSNSGENQYLIIDSHSRDLKLVNGIMFLNKKPFSGMLVSYFDSKQLKSNVEYKDGKKHGYEKRWYPNDTLSVQRQYNKGTKVAIHKGWWENGHQKFIYHFNDSGAYHGNVKEWYQSNQLFRDFNYINGKEEGKQRLWKSDGSIKANYEVIEGERFGLIGLKKCYKLTTNNNKIQ